MVASVFEYDFLAVSYLIQVYVGLAIMDPGTGVSVLEVCPTRPQTTVLLPATVHTQQVVGGVLSSRGTPQRRTPTDGMYLFKRTYAATVMII